ncbi:FTR1 family iron permease [Paenibacillus thermotolerans]|uniref:FTR1 family iron permease n=1 Tax=Paenibacillus thermotolerans TaxID=3027807 RepID=UPI0023680246|nr:MULTISPECIES: FTR1 family protein [unclassified Paenibacillus]
MKRIAIILCTIVLVLLPAAAICSAEPGETAQAVHNELISLSSDALISAGDADWPKAEEAVAGLEAAFLRLGGAADSELAERVNAALTEAEAKLAAADSDPKAAYKAVSALVKAVDAYVSADGQGNEAGQIHENIKPLLAALNDTLSFVQDGDWSGAKSSYDEFVSAWGKAEGAIRSEDSKLYGLIEVKLSGVRIALQSESPDGTKTEEKLTELISVLDDYAEGRAVTAAVAANSAGAAGKAGSIAELIALVQSVQGDIEQGEAGAAYSKMETFISSWPDLEGEVRTRSAQAYTNVESEMIALSSLLASDTPDAEKANGAAERLIQELEPYAAASAYTAWDAFAILFREGLESILIVAALLALLKRSGHEDKRGWIWSGAAAGIVVSAIFAMVLTTVLSNLSTGSSRELAEGAFSLIAVLFMVTVGAWLHGKSNLKNWNRFVERTIGASLAGGALWSLAITAFLTVMREGAETIIFYIGMAPSIALKDLLVGIGAAALVLAAIAFAVLKLSVRIPISPFFRIAGLLMYYMAFKFTGVGVHALQVSGTVPAHKAAWLPEVPSLGVYPTWESAVPQLIVLLIVIGTIVRVEWAKAGRGEAVSGDAPA